MILLSLLVGPNWIIMGVALILRVIAVKVLCEVEWLEAYAMTPVLSFFEGVLLIAFIVYIVYLFFTEGHRITPFM